MQTAHELAQMAAEVAARMNHKEIASFSTEYSLIEDHVRVTLWLTDGTHTCYIVAKEKEGDTPAGESHPDSPSR